MLLPDRIHECSLSDAAIKALLSEYDSPKKEFPTIEIDGVEYCLTGYRALCFGTPRVWLDLVTA